MEWAILIVAPWFLLWAAWIIALRLAGRALIRLAHLMERFGRAT